MDQDAVPGDLQQLRDDRELVADGPIDDVLTQYMADTDNGF